ncbi:hypothetical protein CEV33_4319 [Brucella grignonensis]|uniref:Uncharacterized protein n=1 Tax=Brucella grignonensis TaxID=94627 RepID=A0A256FNH5_9HYPH|nr:hypothetical protein CEV33_4319 [Brucella grignonensis]
MKRFIDNNRDFVAPPPNFVDFTEAMVSFPCHITAPELLDKTIISCYVLQMNRFIFRM